MTALPKTTPGERRTIRALLAATVLVVVMDLTILNVALDDVQRALGASNGELQWAIDSYMITFAAFIFTAGVLGDRLGRRRILVAGLVVFGVGSLLAGLSGSAGALIAWRAVMGVGAAVVPTVTLAIILNVFPPAERPKAIATWAAAAGVAFAVGPLLGGLLLSVFDWGSVFFVNVPLVVASGVLIARLVPESRATTTARLDPLGLVLSIAAIGLLVFGIVRGGEAGWSSPGALLGVVGGLALVVALVALERRAATPSLDVGLFRHRRFAAGTAVIALAFFGLMGTMYLTTFYFQSVRGWSALQAGLLMLPMGVGSAVMSSRCPRLVPVLGPRGVVAPGALLMALVFGAYALVGRDTPVALLVVLQAAFGVGWGCIMAPATAAMMSVVPPQKAGAGQAVAQTLRQVGAALGVAVVGSVLGASYRGALGSAADELPGALRETASTSIGGTLQAAQQIGADARAALVESGLDAYVAAMHDAALVAALVTLVASLVAARLLPGRSSAPAAAGTAPAPTPTDVRTGSPA